MSEQGKVTWRLVVESVSGDALQYHFDEEPTCVAANGFSPPNPDETSVLTYSGECSGREWEIHLVLRNVVAWHLQRVIED